MGGYEYAVYASGIDDWIVACAGSAASDAKLAACVDAV